MIFFKMLRSGIDVSELKKELRHNDNLWSDITARQNTPGSAHTDTETIFLRWAKEQTIDACFNDLVPVEYPAINVLPAAKKLIDEIHGLVGGELGRAIIVKLKPDGIITQHIDEGLYADYYDRFHLPIYTNSENNLYVASDDRSGEYCNMREGELWWFDHKRPHFGCNTSSVNRVHLIVDIRVKGFR